MSQYQKGLLIVAFGVFILSFDALLVRLASTSAWNVVFWRGLLIAFSLTITSFWYDWRKLYQVARCKRNILISMVLLSGVGMILFPHSIERTVVVNTVVILTSTPIFAAIFTWLFLKESIARRTWVAMIVVFAAIIVIMLDSLRSGGFSGDILALLAAINFGANMTLWRAQPAIPRVPVILLSGLIAAVICLPFATPLSLSTNNLAVVALSGLVQMPLALLLITVGTRYLSSPEVTLLLLIETLLGPLWVWLVLLEQPDWSTLVSGAVIACTIIVHSWLGLRSSERD